MPWVPQTSQTPSGRLLLSSPGQVSETVFSPKRYLFIYCVLVFCLHVLCTTFAMTSEEGVGSLELEFQTIVSCHVGTRTEPGSSGRAASSLTSEPL